MDCCDVRLSDIDTCTYIGTVTNFGASSYIGTGIDIGTNTDILNVTDIFTDFDICTDFDILYWHWYCDIDIGTDIAIDIGTVTVDCMSHNT